jgi:predicted HTH domain antitoxin
LLPKSDWGAAWNGSIVNGPATRPARRERMEVGGTPANEEASFMRVLEIPYSEDLLIVSGQEPQELEQELRFLLASKLFELRRLSLGKASELASIPRLQFMDELGRRQIPVINLAEDQIADELRDD